MKLYTEEQVKEIANKMYGRGIARAELIIRSGGKLQHLREYVYNYAEGAEKGYDSLMKNDESIMMS